MIAQKYRLREYEVSRVFKKGRPFFWTYWTMNAYEARGTHHRMAVSISRKHDKRAVQRNRYRRGLYDAMKNLLIVPSTDSNDKLWTINNKRYQVVFTLKKGLKIPEKKIPQAWIDDAIQIFTNAKKK